MGVWDSVAAIFLLIFCELNAVEIEFLKVRNHSANKLKDSAITRIFLNVVLINKKTGNVHTFARFILARR